MESAIHTKELTLPIPVNTAASLDEPLNADNFHKSYVNNLTDQLRAHIPSELNVDVNMELDNDEIPVEDDILDSESYEILETKSVAKKKSYMFGKLSGSRWVTKKASSIFLLY